MATQEGVLASLDKSSISSIAEKLQESVNFLHSLSNEDEPSKAKRIQEFTEANPMLFEHLVTTVGRPIANSQLENPFAERALVNGPNEGLTPSNSTENIPEVPDSIPPSDSDSNSTSDSDKNRDTIICSLSGVPENSPIEADNVSIVSTEDDPPQQLPGGLVTTDSSNATDALSIQSPNLAASGLQTENSDNSAPAISSPTCTPMSELLATDASESSTSATNYDIATNATVRSKPPKAKGKKVYEKKSKPQKKRSKSLQPSIINFPAGDADVAALPKQPHQRRSTLPSVAQKAIKPLHPSSEEFMPTSEPVIPFVAMHESTSEVASAVSNCEERKRKTGVIDSTGPLLNVKEYQKELEATRERLMASQLKAMTMEREKDKEIAGLQKQASKVEQLRSQLAAKEKECYVLRCQISDEIDQDQETDRTEEDQKKWDLQNVELALEICRSYTTRDDYFHKIFSKMHEKTRGLSTRPWSTH